MWDAVSIIVGIIIGATIYKMPPLIFGNLARPEYGIAVWVVGGAFSLLGALCYAELATTYPTAGGDYTYLTRAYGSAAGFWFAWSELSVIRTGGSIAAMAYVFGSATKSIPFFDVKTILGIHVEHRMNMIYAGGSIFLLALVNLAGLKPGKLVQNILTLAKVLGIAGIIVAGAVWYFQGKTPAATKPIETLSDPLSGFGLAMVFVFYAYGGWNEAAYVAAEVRDRSRNITRALILGVSAVTVIYVAINLAYLGGLGVEGVRSFEGGLVPARVLKLHLGDAGAITMTVLIMISALGAINGLLFTGIRLYGAFGSDEKLFAGLARQSKVGVAPGAIFAQVFFSIALIALVEYSDHWKRGLEWSATKAGVTLPSFLMPPAPLPPDQTPRSKDFDDLVNCTAPVFWLFFSLTGYAVLVLRARDPQRERPFRVPLYPITPLLFLGSSLFMLYRSVIYAISQSPAEALIVALFMALGIPLYALSGPSDAGNNLFARFQGGSRN
jgi:amino acid transporter